MKVLLFLLFSSASIGIVYSQNCINIPPVAVAGSDTIIQNNQASCTPNPVTITLNGSSSFDPDGTIVSYLWSGSDSITNPASAITTLTGLLPGTYTFILRVADNNGAFAYDTVHISIVPANRPLIQTQLIPIGTLSQTRYAFTIGAGSPISTISIGAAGNKILFAGGETSNVCATTRVDIYDVVNGNWTISELSQARFGAGATTLGNKIFFGGGIVPLPGPPGPGCYFTNMINTRTSVIDIYDVSTNTWSIAQLSSPRLVTGVAVNSKAVFAGGDAIFWQPNNRADIYDAGTNSWSIDSLSIARVLDQPAITIDKIYFPGGSEDFYGGSGGSATDRIDIYNTVTNSWSIDSLSRIRTRMGNLIADTKLYCGGGWIWDSTANRWNSTNSVEIRDLVSNTITFDCLAEPRVEVTALRKDNKIVFINSWGDVNMFDILDLTTNSWSIGILPQTISWASFFCYNNIIYTTDGNHVWKLGIDNCVNNTADTITASSCNSYILNGKTYRASGLYTQTLTNAAGCDSTITLNLTINYSTNCTMSVSACDSFTWHGQTYTSSGFYSDTLVSSGGCDSILNLNLTINHSSDTTTSVTACNSYTWRGQTYTVSGFYSDTLVSSNGCDSILNLNLAINHSFDTTISVTTCDSYTWRGRTYTVTGYYSDTLVSPNGCDSTLHLDLTIKHSSDTTIAVTACDSYTWRGQTYTLSGVYSDTLISSNGCDSILNLNLTINHKVTSTVNATICQGQIYAGHTTNGIYVDTLVSVSGCDSIRTLNLTVNPGSFSMINARICRGENYAGYTSTGIYIDTLTAANGCDSVRTINLTLKNNCDIYIPNAFTPNNDGLNDLFRPTINLPFKQYSFNIFNRYGEKIFETHEYGKGWDGRYREKDQPSGSYVYRITYTLMNGHEEEYKGTVLLIR